MAISKPSFINRIWARLGVVFDPTVGKYDEGWIVEIPDHESMNFLQKNITEAIVHNNEQGINEWDAETEYPVSALAKGIDGFIYKSNVSNSGQDPVTSNRWDRWGEASEDTGLPAGTAMLFYQASAPVGWTQLNVDNRMVRTVNSTGGAMGGFDSPILNNRVPYHTHPFENTTTASGNHGHGLTAGKSIVASDGVGGTYEGGQFIFGTVGIWKLDGNHSHHVSGTTSGNSGANNWVPRYMDVIVAKKDASVNVN